jgi:D-threonate/D-erythronate kinase
MNLVLADDITGAAEVAGIAHDQGHPSWVLRAGKTLPPDVPQDGIIVVDTDSRSMPVADAMAAVDGALTALRGAPVLFKKVDSVLRGHVLAEIRRTMERSGQSRTILLPANPSRGRIIRDGLYYIDGRPIAETSFRRDPEFPAKESTVLSLLRSPGASDVHLVRVGAPLPDSGCVVAEAASTEEVAAWAERADDQTLCAGGADFFSAILRRQLPPGRRPSVASRRTGRALAIFGSKSLSSRIELQNVLQSKAVAVASAPVDITIGRTRAHRLAAWTSRAVRLAQTVETLVLETSRVHGSPAVVRAVTAQVAARLLKALPFEEVYIEGGATASAILNAIGAAQLRVVEQIECGTVRLRGVDPHLPDLILKPGSYAWPPCFKQRCRMLRSVGGPIPMAGRMFRPAIGVQV